MSKIKIIIEKYIYKYLLFISFCILFIIPIFIARYSGNLSLPVLFWEISLIFILPRLMAITLLFVISFISWIRAATYFYLLDQPFLAIYYIYNNLYYFPISIKIVMFIIFIIVFCMIIYSAIIIADNVSSSWRGSIIYLTMTVVLSMLSTSIYGSFSGSNLGHLWGQVNFVKMLSQDFSVNAMTSGPSKTSPAYLASQTALRRRENFNLIIVESMGVPRSRMAAKELDQRLVGPSLQGRLVISGNQRPTGSTLHAEIQHLCGGYLRFGLLGKASEVHCIPYVFKAAGYKTLAFHANYPNVYGRNLWYPRVGFRSVTFKPPRGPSSIWQVGWGGQNDLDSLPKFFSRPVRPARPEFRYFLTISTHVPVIAINKSGKIKQPEKGDPGNTKTHNSNINLVADELHKIIESRPTEWFVIVGDHPPPFYNGLSRREYYPNETPFWIIRPRDKIL